MDKETVEEYIKRGGEIQIIPPSPGGRAQTQFIKPNNTLLTLSHGQDLFSKKNQRKTNTTESK